MNCELVMIGSELLLGQVVDTNASYLAQRLAEIGMNLYYKTTVGDNLQRMVAALNLATSRADVVITSGGLGPTEDDLTREAVAEVTGGELEFHQELFDEIEGWFASRSLTMSPNNRRQAFLPRGARTLRNPVGTAPAFVIESSTSTIIALPGVPAELKEITETSVLPYLSRKVMPEGAVILSRELKASGIGESAVDQRIGDLIRASSNPTVGILAQAGEIVIRITAKAQDRDSASHMIDETEARVRERVGAFIFGVDRETLEGVVARILEEQNETLCVIETGTGGAIAQRLIATNTAQVLGYEVLPQRRTIELFLSCSDETCDELAAEPRSLARRLAAVARDKYRADMVLVVLEGTGFGLSRSWVLLDGCRDDRLHEIAIRGRDEWSQRRLAVIALELTRKALLGIAVSG
jgi:nicotinamide-nucleotide amidase